MPTIHCSLIDFYSPLFDLNLDLRDAILRKPINMSFTPGQISQEWDSYHIGAFVGTSLVGTMILKPIDGNIIKMRQVAVAASMQGNGIGKILVNYCEAFAKHKNYKTIVLHAREVAQKFYLKLDYHIVGEEFLEVGLPHYKMEKRIN